MFILVLFTCNFCKLEKQTKNAMSNHISRCRKNPNRKIQTGGGSAIAWNKGLTKATYNRVAHSDINKKNMQGINLGRKHSEEFKNKARVNAIKRSLGGVRQSKKITYNGKTLGSSYELIVAKSLDENKITWDTCKRIKYTDPFGKERTYTPDFYLVEYDVYLDPKNDFLIEKLNPSLGFNDLEKIRCVEEQNKIKIIVLNSNQLHWNSILKLIETLGN